MLQYQLEDVICREKKQITPIETVMKDLYIYTFRVLNSRMSKVSITCLIDIFLFIFIYLFIFLSYGCKWSSDINNVIGQAQSEFEAIILYIIDQAYYFFCFKHCDFTEFKNSLRGST